MLRSGPLAALATIEINSLGGDVRSALAIGDRIAPIRPHIVVVGECSSSCANYLLPIASRITLRPGARILLHGSIDEATVARISSQIGQRDGFQRIADEQTRFVADHGIHPGWLLYRRDGDAGTWGRHVSTPVTMEVQDRPILYLMVEEPFLRSCLAGIPIEGLEVSRAVEARRDGAVRRRLASRGIALTGEMACIERGPAPTGRTLQ